MTFAASPAASSPATVRDAARWTRAALDHAAFALAFAYAAHGVKEPVIKLMGHAPAWLSATTLIPHLAALWLVLAHTSAATRAAARLWPAWPLLGLASASVLWSIDATDTVIEATTLVSLALIAAWAVGQWTWRGAAWRALIVFAVLAGLSILAAGLAPHLAASSPQHPGAWSGWFLEKNTLGQVMAVAALLALALLTADARRRALAGTALAVFLALVTLSTSKTAFAMVGVGFGAWALVVIARRPPAIASLGLYIGLAFAAFIAFGVTTQWDSVLEALGRSATLTARVDVWTAVAPHAAAAPWGYGYGVFWDDPHTFAPLADVTERLGFEPTHAHSAWLDMRLACGPLGVAALALTLAAVALRALRKADPPGLALASLPLLAAALVASFVESNIVGPVGPALILLLGWLAAPRAVVSRRPAAR